MGFEITLPFTTYPNGQAIKGHKQGNTNKRKSGEYIPCTTYSFLVVDSLFFIPAGMGQKGVNDTIKKY